MMFFIFLPPFLSLLLTPDVEKFIHALTDLCTSDNSQVKGAWNIIIKIHKIVDMTQVKSSFWLLTVPS